jgi:hypothetical protein
MVYRYLSIRTGTLHHLLLFAALLRQLLVRVANLPNFTVLRCVLCSSLVHSRPPIFMFVLI